MELTRENIFTTIDSKEKQQRAIDILKKHEEEKWGDKTSAYFDNFYNSLVFVDNVWFITGSPSYKTEITLDQLDELLTKLNLK